MKTKGKKKRIFRKAEDPLFYGKGVKKMGMDLELAIKLATLLIPLIDQVIKWIEKLFPRVEGSVKRAKAISVIRGLIPEGSDGEKEIERLTGSLIDTRVEMFNAAGVFKHRKPKEK
jgi:hypothetical protein